MASQLFLHLREVIASLNELEISFLFFEELAESLLESFVLSVINAAQI